ncbi:tetratricopeptide repeat protein [Streptomyces xanthophaeus]
MAWWRWSKRTAVHTGGNTTNVFSGGTVSTLVQGQHISVRLPRDVPDALRGLPPAPAVFTGREDEITHIASLLTPAASKEAGSGRAVSVVAGMAGVGKSALALRVAHDLVAAGHFTGGAIFLRLHGYDAPNRLGPEEIALEMLGMLGVPAEVIPAGAQARTAVMRTVLSSLADAGHRVLIVLDDASSGEQILPALPGNTAHPVLVTSRHTLTGLDAHTTDLNVLSDRASFDLLSAALQDTLPGDTRLRRRTRTVRSLITACAGLPLALRIVAGRLTASPGLTPAALAADLFDGARRLDGLDDGERAIQAALDLSYAHLLTTGHPDSARLLRLAAENPSATFTAEAAAVLSGLDPTTTQRALAELERAHLVEATGPEHHRLHDLVRLHARTIPDTEREQAVERLLAHYRTQVSALGPVAATAATRATPEAADPGDARNARTWFAVERDALQTALEYAADHNDHTTVLTVAFGFHHYLEHIREHTHAVYNARLAQRAAESLNKPHDVGKALNNLGTALQNMRRFDEAISTLERARDLFHTTNDPHNQANTWANLGIALQSMRRFDEAITAHHRALALYEAVNDPLGHAKTWINLGIVLRELRRFDEAITAHHRALALLETADDPHSQAVTWGNLGMVLRELRRFDEAITAHHRALALLETADDPHSQAVTWSNLAIALQSMRRFDEAITAHDRALALFEATDDSLGQAVTWNKLGVVLRGLCRFEEAITAHHRALGLLETTDAPHNQAAAWSDLGLVLQEVRRFDEAITAHHRALALYEATDDPHSQAQSWTNLATALQDVHRFDEAITALEHARGYFETADDPHSQAATWANLGIVLRGLRRFDEAITAHHRALGLLEATVDPHNQAKTWTNLGVVLRETHQFDEAITALEHARDLFHATNDPENHSVTTQMLRSITNQVEAIRTTRPQAIAKTQAPPDLTASGFTGSLNLLFPAEGPSRPASEPPSTD